MDPAIERIPVNLAGRRFGPVQKAGPLAVVPILGDDGDARFVPPLTGMKLSRVTGYGKVEMECRPGNTAGIGIVPLHIGYIQDGAQNHALCRSALLAAGQKRMFEDACCVQQSQGGYLEGRDQWFFILPLALRDAALRLRGTSNYGKLWSDIANLNTTMGKNSRGHLEEIVCRERPWLTQYNARFERLPEQLGALFVLDGKLVGIELAPTHAYFAEVWPALVCFCYGVEAMRREHASTATPEPAYEATDLVSLRREVEARRAYTDAMIARALAAVPQTRMELVEEERLLDVELFTAISAQFSGQLVEHRGSTVYASLAARPAWLA
jgi:hypothetical protein